MLPLRLLRFSTRGDAIHPHFLTEADRPWLRSLCEVFEDFAGQPRRALQERLRLPLPRRAPGGKVEMAAHVLDRLTRDATAPCVPPRRARAAAFVAAARAPGDRESALAHAAADLGVAPAVVEACLFADLPGERKVGPVPLQLTPGGLALRTNLALVQGLLRRSTGVVIEAQGNARPLVRYAKLRGLICVVRGQPGSGRASLEVSGPLSLFHRTIVYGRALGGLIPCLPWCDRFELQAICVLEDRERILTLGTRDPILGGREPRRFDSRLEERFAKDWGRSTCDWDLIREPEPIPAKGTLIFPDFALVHRLDPDRRWMLEIVGFWTPGYLEQKLAHLREARLERLILCVDSTRACAAQDLPDHAQVLPFRGRVPVDQVLALVTGTA